MIRLADRQGLLSQAGEINRVQQWALAWLMNEETRILHKNHFERDEAFVKNIMYIVNPEMYKAIYLKQNDDPDYIEGYDLAPEDVLDVLDRLEKKITMSVGDIIKDEENWI